MQVRIRATQSAPPVHMANQEESNVSSAMEENLLLLEPVVVEIVERGNLAKLWPLFAATASPENSALRDHRRALLAM